MNSPNPMGDNGGARLFVYGTLRKGFRAHKLLQRFCPRFLGVGQVRGRLYNLGKYPGATETTHTNDRIQGELYWLARATAAFKVLDRFEGFHPRRPASNEFERRETTVTMLDGSESLAWIYWLSRTRPAGRRILSGNYVLHRK